MPAWVPDGAEGVFATREVSGVEPPERVSIARPRARQLSPAELAAALQEGDRGALARAITLVESNAPRHRDTARAVLEAVASAGGSARHIGISGVPGAGKSTFIESFGNMLCDLGRKVAVLAVDPSSTLSGGSILGDKTRMETLSRRPECFIRPSPSAGALGGVGRKTRETILLCEAAGYDTVLIETVGVGQSEIEVRSMVDCFLLLMIAGAGDELQGMKKGIIEIADIVAVNKADGDNLTRARATRVELERVLAFLSPVTDGWRPPVHAISSLERKGLSDLWDTIGEFYTHVEATGQFRARRADQAISWWRALVDQELRSRFLAKPEIAAQASALESRIRAGELAPSLAAEELLAALDAFPE